MASEPSQKLVVAQAVPLPSGRFGMGILTGRGVHVDRRAIHVLWHVKLDTRSWNGLRDRFVVQTPYSNE
ncbi:MAG: hypothetical protein RL153_1911 [Verrucomicrobiota bacterium]|jgi:hypothetical protein